MMPITKTIAAVLSVTTSIAAAHAAPGGLAAPSPQPERSRTIARTESGFVIRATLQNDIGANSAVSAPVPAQLIPVGSGVHVDAHLLARPTRSNQENPYAHR